MKMNPNQRLKTSNNAVRVFKGCLIMMALIVVVGLAFSCMGAQNQMAIDASDVELIQYKVPDDDTPVVIFETTMGTMKAVLFEDEAPNYCEYFIDLVNDGYYEDTHYFMIENEQHAYAFGGAKDKTGDDTDDTDKKQLEPETSKNLWPFTGALCTYGAEKGIFNKRNVTGSRIIFVNSVDFTDEFVAEMKAIEDANETILNAFLDNGGVPNFSQQFTVFGQIYEGLDVLEAITSVEVNDDKEPLEDVKIIKATISTYGENKLENEEEFFTESFKEEAGSSEASSSANE